MSLVEEARQDGLFYKWKVENFRYIPYEEGFINSPIFAMRNLDSSRWCLRLKTCRETFGNNIACGLIRVDDNAPKEIKIGFEFSVIVNDKLFDRTSNELNLFFQHQCPRMFDFSLETFLGLNENFLCNDSLTVCFRIRKIGVKCEIVDPMQFFARTCITVHRKSFVWPINRFSSLKNYEKRSYFLRFLTKEISPLLIINIYRTSLQENLQIEINQTTPSRSQILTCHLTMLYSKGDEGNVKKHGIFDIDNKRVWKFNFGLPVAKLLRLKDNYLPNDTLTLIFEIGICNGDQIVEIVEGNHYDPPSSSTSDVNTVEQNPYVNQTETKIPSCLKDALLDLYQNNKFCDVTIRTERSSFPVHKNVLCARSSVFSAMFDGDLKENRTGIVEIPDLTDDTVQRMLMFMYSDTVKDLEWENAMNLYVAADKYDVMPLRQQCAKFLKANMKVSNVTDILVLADRHQDEDLKSATYDFILKNDIEVISSDLWKNFMDNNLKLAAETTHLIYKKKLGKVKV